MSTKYIITKYVNNLDFLAKPQSLPIISRGGPLSPGISGKPSLPTLYNITHGHPLALETPGTVKEMGDTHHPMDSFG